jgi:hypothetical protein
MKKMRLVPSGGSDARTPMRKIRLVSSKPQPRDRVSLYDGQTRALVPPRKVSMPTLPACPQAWSRGVKRDGHRVRGRGSDPRQATSGGRRAGVGAVREGWLTKGCRWSGGCIVLGESKEGKRACHTRFQPSPRFDPSSPNARYLDTRRAAQSWRPILYRNPVKKSASSWGEARKFVDSVRTGSGIARPLREEGKGELRNLSHG